MNVPSLLKDKPNWLVWSFEAAAGSGKPRKIPHYADGGRRHGRNGRAADRQRLVCFDDALEAAAKMDMAGVCQWSLKSAPLWAPKSAPL
jgi:putative DNA primase/helicase